MTRHPGDPVPSDRDSGPLVCLFDELNTPAAGVTWTRPWPSAAAGPASTPIAGPFVERLRNLLRR